MLNFKQFNERNSAFIDTLLNNSKTIPTINTISSIVYLVAIMVYVLFQDYFSLITKELIWFTSLATMYFLNVFLNMACIHKLSCLRIEHTKNLTKLFVKFSEVHVNTRSATDRELEMSLRNEQLTQEIKFLHEELTKLRTK